MDGHRFDQFVRLRALGASRRTVIASLFGSLAATTSMRVALADCVPTEPCANDQDCCSQSCCDGTCTDTFSNDLNCGACGNVCSLDEYCDNGGCTAFCDPGLTLCGIDCIDTTTDPDHCGGCDNGCGGLDCCDGTCTDVQFDDANCGQCASPCLSSETCNAGVCEAAPTCPAGETDCDGTCRNLATDEANCGDCGFTCDAGDVCTAGQCVADTDNCPGDAVDCSGSCVDLTTDAANCGACGNACGGPCCGGVCADLTADPANCGACGNACGGEQPICADSVCLTGLCEADEQGLETIHETSVVAPDGLALATKTISRETDNGKYDGFWSRTRVTRGDELVLEYRYDFRPSETWTIIVEYGPDFGGALKATFKGAKGELISGEIDGRAVRPFNPRSEGARVDWLEPLADEPEPIGGLDPDLADALARLFEQATQEALACEVHLQREFPVDADETEGATAQALGVGVRLFRRQAGTCDAGVPQTPSLGSSGCIACRAACMTAGATCGYTAAITCPSIAAACLIGYPACLGACLAVSLTACALTQYACQQACRAAGGPCCPVGCGGACCGKGQTCLDETSGLCCTEPGATPCGGTCCCGPEDVCMADGSCCPKDADMCGDSCCAAGETCSDGVCCAKVCDKVSPSQCCESMEQCTECGCCAPGTTCSMTLDFEPVCCPDGQVCGDVCCPNGESCEDPARGTCLGSESCAEGEDACPGGICCPRVTTQGGGEIDTCCGEVCCPEDTPYCCGEATDGGEPDCRAYNCIR